MTASLTVCVCTRLRDGEGRLRVRASRGRGEKDRMGETHTECGGREGETQGTREMETETDPKAGGQGWGEEPCTDGALLSEAGFSTAVLGSAQKPREGLRFPFSHTARGGKSGSRLRLLDSRALSPGSASSSRWGVRAGCVGECACVFLWERLRVQV